MTTSEPASAVSRLEVELESPVSSVRLQAALTAGTYPATEYVAVLIERCASEPDLYVREMLSWALMRHDSDATLDLLLAEVRSETVQAQSQALHTLSKIGDPRAWPAITRELLESENDEVARTAWRAAAKLVPTGGEAALAEALATQLGRGDRAMQHSLSRAFVTVGALCWIALDRARSDIKPQVRIHALATEHLMQNPDDGFETAMFEARKLDALNNAQAADE